MWNISKPLPAGLFSITVFFNFHTAFSALLVVDMNIGKTLYVSDRGHWRNWLQENHLKEKEIWLIYYYKKTGKPRIPYDDAVEEALCFGWIDSTVKKIDEMRYAQRFSPRRKNSPLSQANKERIVKLISNHQMTQAGLNAIADVFKPGGEIEVEFIVPPDILEAIKANPAAWENYIKLPPAYRRTRIAYIDSRRRHGEVMFRKSLEHFIKMTEKGKRFGFVHVQAP